MKNSEKIADSLLLSSQADPRLIIYKEIETYRSKLSEYEQLQKQFNELNLHLNASQPAQNDAGKLSRAKSEKGKAAGSTTKRNSHKKIKIYELQKKYDRAARENEEKRSILERNMQTHNKILWQIEEVSNKIEDQKKSTENLKQLSLQIEGDLEANSAKVERQVVNLQRSVKEKELCNYGRKKIREDIKRTRMLIHNVTNNLTEDLELSYSDEDERQAPKSVTSLPDAAGSRGEDLPQATDLQIWMDKQAKRIETAFSKYDNNHEKNEKYLHDFYALKKEMISNELLVKHHKVTIALQTARVREYEGLVQRYRQNIGKRSEKAKEVTAKINKLDGERGFMRGSIGVKIEEQRLVRAVNALLEEDLRRVRDKFCYLHFLKNLAQKQTS